MKTMNYHDSQLGKWIGSILGLMSGVIGYLKIHFGFDTGLWGGALDKIISTLGAMLVALLTGAAGYAGTVFMKWVFKKVLKKGIVKEADE